MSAETNKIKEAIENLDKLFLTAFDTNHPAMLDWIRIKMERKRVMETLTRISKETFCYGMNCRFCRSHKRHPSTVGATMAQKILDKEKI